MRPVIWEKYETEKVNFIDYFKQLGLMQMALNGDKKSPIKEIIGNDIKIYGHSRWTIVTDNEEIPLEKYALTENLSELSFEKQQTEVLKRYGEKKIKWHGIVEKNRLFTPVAAAVLGDSELDSYETCFLFGIRQNVMNFSAGVFGLTFSPTTSKTYQDTLKHVKSFN